MVTASQYNLAHDPEYDSIAPGLAIVSGWFFGLIFSSFCVLAVMIATTIRNWIAKG